MPRAKARAKKGKGVAKSQPKKVTKELEKELEKEIVNNKGNEEEKVNADKVVEVEAVNSDKIAEEKKGKKAKTKGKKKATESTEMELDQSEELPNIVNEEVKNLDYANIKSICIGYWKKKADKFNTKIIQGVYNEHLKKNNFSVKSVATLEFSHYLENYLWPSWSSKTSSLEHLLSIVLLINEKVREGVNAWETVTGVKVADGETLSMDNRCAEKFTAFWDGVIQIFKKDNDKLNFEEKTRLVIFFIHCFKSLENEIVRKQVLPMVSLSAWKYLIPSRLEKELSVSEHLQKMYTQLNKRAEKKLSEIEKARRNRSLGFITELISILFDLLDNFNENDKDTFKAKSKLGERILELLIDIQSQLSTRRYTHALVDDQHVVVKCTTSKFTEIQGEFSVFYKLLQMLKFYMGFEINNVTGAALTDKEMAEIHYKQIKELQRLSFLKFPELSELTLSNVSNVNTKEKLFQLLKPLDDQRLHELASELCLVPSVGENEGTPAFNRDFILAIVAEKYERRLSQIEALNETPLFPSEVILFDENIPSEYSNDSCLALPKLNLQFLTLHDYLLRNLNLFMLESSFEIRQDIIDATKRMPAIMDGEGKTHFEGWARMAVQIEKFNIVEIAKPNLGELKPSRVRADIKFDTRLCRTNIRKEWEEIRKHDIMFLLTIKAKSRTSTKYDPSKPFVPQIGLINIRGCEVEGFMDENNKLLEDTFEKPKQMKGDYRTIRVKLDTNQYSQDLKEGNQTIYENFNLLLRRKPKENNFKPILATIRDLMNTQCVVPEWLHDIFLGYGAPNSAHYLNVSDSKVEHTYDFNDTFLDINHLRDSFPNEIVECDVPDEEAKPPFKITFPIRPESKKKRSADGEVVEKSKLKVLPFKYVNMGPYPQDVPKTNAIRFTPVQTEAIRSAMHHGLTMVVGPPGTGKTDVAVQMISNWYHNNPEQRTLLITHSNQALNQLFEKIMCLDIDERHLLRLGMGEKDLASDKVFTKYGRVNYILERRIKLLKEVTRLAEGFGVKGDIGYTCETAGYFYLHHVVARWEEFLSKIQKQKNEKKKTDDHIIISNEFPFTFYFESAPQPLFKNKSYEEDFDIAEGCYRHISKIFTELEEFKAFEILRTGLDRVDYLLVKEAKIIAMTCTHAALKREDLVKLKFQYDNVLLEEAGQILEIETFIPLMCQNPSDGASRLKRVVLIGDHHQLPPVIKNQAFQKFCNMEQSLFTRFIRLNVPAVQLNKQGRARSSISKLYNWRYKDLGNLEHVNNLPEYQLANSGFNFDYQFIDVPDLNGQGESQPQPYFYQNLAEAEYVIWTFMYMRLLGIPADKISIITSYNGQKHLIRDVLNSRCSWNPMYGSPLKITTVDRYQGQQNDYILLSLVRTRSVGHVRDVRRLVVALSRSRLGLYVFGRESLFSSCLELRNAMSIFRERPTKLTIVPSELYPTSRKVTDQLPANRTRVINGLQEMSAVVQEMENLYKIQEDRHKILNPSSSSIENQNEKNKTIITSTTTTTITATTTTPTTTPASAATTTETTETTLDKNKKLKRK